MYVILLEELEGKGFVHKTISEISVHGYSHSSPLHLQLHHTLETALMSDHSFSYEVADLDSDPGWNTEKGYA